MAAGEEKLKLVLDAIDKTAAPLRAVNRRIEGMLAPVRKVRNAFQSLSKEAGLPQLGKALAWTGRQLAKMAAAGVAAAAGILEFTRRTIDWADSLSETTTQLGIGIEEFQELQYAAKRAGVDNDAFAGSMQALTKNVGSLKAGTGPLLGLLKDVDPVLAKQVAHSTNLAEAFELVVGKLRRLKDPFKQNKLAAAAFGRSGQSLALMATQSSEKFEELKRRARELGMVLSKDAADAAEDAQDSLDDLQGSVMGIARSIALSLAPDIKELADDMLLWISKNRELVKTKAAEFIKDFAAGVRATAIFLTVNLPKLNETIQALGGVKTVLGAIAAIALAPVAKVVIALATAMGAVGLAVLGTGAALAYVLIQLEKLTGFKQALLDVIDPFSSKSSLRQAFSKIGPGFGLGATRTSRPMTLGAPGQGIAPQAAAAARNQVDVSGLINLRVDQRGARITGAESASPTVGFGLMPRGPALAPN